MAGTTPAPCAGTDLLGVGAKRHRDGGEIVPVVRQRRRIDREEHVRELYEKTRRLLFEAQHRPPDGQPAAEATRLESRPCASCGRAAAAAVGSPCRCTFCEGPVCEACRLPVCYQCGGMFCALCCIVDYNTDADRCVCLSCEQSLRKQRR